MRRTYERPTVTFIAFLILGAVITSYPVAAEQPTAEGEKGMAASGPDFVVYYFHGNKRCTTCRTIEALSQEAVRSGFTEELNSGVIEWRAVNVDEKENRHFITDFELVTKSVVLVEYAGENVARFQNLRLVWQLAGNKEGFLKYVSDSTREFIGQS